MAIIKQENVAAIVKTAPQAYSENTVSHDRCVEFGQGVLQRIHEQGMTDELDQQAATFIERARKTLAKMNSRRSPVTKLFDEIRKAYTLMENDIDPTKSGTVGWQLQQLRNQYAAKKRAEEERKRQELVLRQQHQASVDKYRADCEADYGRKFTALVNGDVNALFEISNMVTLDNYTESYERLKGISTALAADWQLPSGAYLPANLKPDETKAIRTEVWARLKPHFMEQYHFEVESNRDNILDMLPSKKKELEAMAKADAAKQAQLKAEMERREAEMAAQREAERTKKEEEALRQADMQQQAASINDLFGRQAAAASVAAYQPKTAVKLRLNPLNPEAFMQIVSLWWSKEGCRMSVEELSKTFKKQLAFCEKLANDKSDPVRIESEHIEYVEDVKAK